MNNTPITDVQISLRAKLMALEHHPGNLTKAATDELINEALEHLEAQEPELAHIVMLRFFGGLTNQHVAETLQLSVRTVDSRWAYAKARLFRYIRSQQ